MKQRNICNIQKSQLTIWKIRTVILRALSEQQMDVLVDKYIIGLYQDLEDEVIADIARRVKKTGRFTETAELMAKSMVENGFSADKIRVEVMKLLRADKEYQMAVAENTMAYKREVQQIIDATVESAKEAGNTLTAEAGNMAWNNDLSMWEQQGEDLTKPNSLSKFVKASSLQTAGALKNLTKTMGFKNTALGTTGVLDMYQREMDLALIKVSTGAFSFEQAVNDCVHRLAQSGLKSIDYANGRSYQLDVAARMAVRTGMSQLSGKITEENLKNSGHDLVITTQHMGSRPEHVPWQNKVFSYSGKSKKYPDFFKETGYGTVTGLKGANCTHDFYPYWEGASVIPEDIKEPEPRMIGGKTYTYYESTQKQRQMERQIRATKREIEAQKNIGGDTQELQSKLRGQMADYKSFSKSAGLKERNNRLRVESGSSNKKTVNKINNKNSVDVFQKLKNKGVEVDIDGAGKYKEQAVESVKHIDKLFEEYNSTMVSYTISNNMSGIITEVGSAYMLNGKTAVSVMPRALKNVKATDALNLGDKQFLGTTYHEFAHTLSQSREKDNTEFWKEMRKLKKEYESNRGKSNWIGAKISDYASKDVDEFFAEAFTQAKLAENPSQYSKRALEIVDKYFKKTSLESTDKSSIMKIDLQLFASKEKQYGKKIGKHAQDFGLDASKEADRLKMHEIIADIINNKDEIRIGSWRGQDIDVLFFVKGNDVVITKADGEFVTILKDGVKNSARVKNARKL